MRQGQATPSWWHGQRIAAVMAQVAACAPHSVLDLGCGEGAVLRALAALDPPVQVTGVDQSAALLAQAQAWLDGLGLDGLGPDVAGRVDLREGSVLDAGLPLTGFDCAVLVEVIEHLAPRDLSALERAVFGVWRPGRVIVTTPNVEFNHLLNVPPTRFRHPDHKFEWNRRQFRDWADGVGARNGYRVALTTVAGGHPDFGGASHMAVFDGG